MWTLKVKQNENKLTDTESKQLTVKRERELDIIYNIRSMVNNNFVWGQGIIRFTVMIIS